MCWEVLAEGDMEARSGVSERGACGKGNTRNSFKVLASERKKRSGTGTPVLEKNK